MSEFTIRSESVDVDQIMKQIRQRILEKRGADYTEDQIRELASVRLEKFLDPKNLRSDLLMQFRKSRPSVNTDPPAIVPPYTAEEADIFATHRGALRFMRKLFSPLMKLMFNPNPLLHVIHKQADFNTTLLKREARRRIEFDQSRAEWNSLYYEVLHNLVLETTRMGIEVQNLRMKVESLSSRLDFSERRVRALEGVVQYRPEVIRGSDRHDSADDDETPMQQAPSGSIEGFVPAGGQQLGQGQGQGDGTRRRRRRRRGRRGGQGDQGAPGAQGAHGAQGGQGAPGAQGANDFEDADNGEEGGEEFEPMDAGAEAQEALAANESVQQPEREERHDAPAQSDTPAADAPVTPDAPASDDDLQ
ncbi:MAG: hypothetical protein ABI983_04305 [Acidobacteriota bacterium]